MRACNICGAEKPLDEFHRDNAASDGRSRRCKECAKARSRRWNAENRAKKSASGKAHYEANKPAYRAYTRKWRSENAERYRAANAARAARNSQHAVERVAAWRKENPEWAARKRREDTARRRAMIKRACPPWADHEKIAEVYALADRLSRETGVPHDVDHIIPIAGRLVCGLHVHTNLRAIPASENRKKSRKEIEWADGEQIPWLFKVKGN